MARRNWKVYRSHAILTLRSGEKIHAGEVFSGEAANEKQGQRQMKRRLKAAYPGKEIVEIEFPDFRIWHDSEQVTPRIDPSRIELKPNRKFRVHIPAIT